MQELIKAIQTNNLDSLKELITKGANFKEIDQIGDTILHLACRVGQLPTVQYLVENCGLNINAENNKGTTPLYEAYITNNFPVIEYLEKRGAVTSSENNEVFYMNELHDAAAKGDLEEAKLLVEKYRASVDARGYGNGTYDEWVLPIHLACRYGHLEMVKY
jgi:ankyrin repeat protein